MKIQLKNTRKEYTKADFEPGTVLEYQGQYWIVAEKDGDYWYREHWDLCIVNLQTGQNNMLKWPLVLEACTPIDAELLVK